MKSKSLLLFSIFSLLFSLSSIAYWQQEVKYNIDVKLNDKTHYLSAFQSLVYLNNSPDTLSHIYMHLWPNAYQDDTQLAKQLLEDDETLLYFNEKQYTGKIDSLDFKVNGKGVLWGTMENYPDIAKLELKQDLFPGDSITITTPFRVKVPVGVVSRLGHIEEDIAKNGKLFNEKSYQISQWYPKPAVFDSIGWHRLPYLNTGEFYSEYGSFNVSITTPLDYTIAATGNQIKSTKKSETKTVSFFQNNVHDFAWFVDNDWITEKSEVTLPHTGRVVETISRYKRINASLWENSVKYIDSAVYYYSLWVGDYPYKVCTAVDGGITAGGGMEYPTITVIGDAINRASLEQVILHEVGHNWFYGVLGTNERLHPWMDEGINSYYERRYYEEVNKTASIADFTTNLIRLIVKDSIPKNKEMHAMMYEIMASRNIDLPINYPAVEYSSLNYGSIVYAKTAIAFNYLEKYLTKPVFDACMQEYYNAWKFRHPEPKDLEKIFTNATTKNLDWFFKDLLSTTYQIDYRISSAQFNEATRKFELIISNRGDIASPVVVSAIRGGKVIRTVWYDGFHGKALLDFPNEEYDEIVIDYYHDIPEINRSNNSLRMYNIFGTIEPFEANFFGDFEKNNKTQLFSMPIVGYNNHDNLQLGFGFYNSLLKEKPFRFMIMPQYSFGTQRFIGSSKFTYSLYPKSGLQKINFNAFYKRQGLDFGIVYGDLEKKEVEVNLIIAKKNDRSKVKSNVSVKLSEVNLAIDRRASLVKRYLTFNYNYTNKKVINPYKVSLLAQSIEKNWKVQGEFKYHLTVNKKNQKINFRLFGGYFLNNNNVGTGVFNLTAGSGFITTANDLSSFSYNTHDYLFDHALIGRFDNNGKHLASQQIYLNDAAFKTGIHYGMSNTWLLATNLTIPTPTKYISFFLDIASNKGIIDDYNDDDTPFPVLYDFGIQVNIIKNYFEIYLPLKYSTELKDNYELKGADKYLNKIKFMFNINELYNLYQ
jgi:hypothetical protein